MGIFLAIVILGSCFAFVSVAQAAKPRTWIVSQDGTGDFIAIQSALDAAQSRDTVYVKAGVYNEHLTIAKTLNLKGENRETTIIDANGVCNEPSGSIVLVLANNVKISGFTLQHCRSGGNALWIDSYNNMIFSNNKITGCNEGVRVVRSSGNVVSYNIVQDCYYNTGIGFDWAFNNIIQGNTLINNHYGSSGGYDNHDNTYLENTFISNDIGFGVTSRNSKFYHNNFIDNDVNVLADGANKFDNGYPSGGNYWSDYAGVDNYRGKTQDKGKADGIGDTQFVINALNVDNYPLMQPFA
jgi:parallel beta-helix repeat protein